MNKIHLLISTLLLLAAISAKSQSLQRDSIAGVWICAEAIVPTGFEIPKEEMEAIPVLKGAIINSKFLFKANGLFEWQFPKGVPAIFQGMDFLNNQKWSIDVKEDMIHVGDPRENLMQIMVREKAGIIYFMLSDTPLLLRMKKE
ncbi:MAG: hypothetical protein R2804_19395 [Cyclobacteriaceae bacterium]